MKGEAHILRSVLRKSNTALFLRFVLSGLWTTTLYFILFLLFAEVIGADEVFSSGLSYILCIAMSYFAQSRFAFRVANDTPSQVSRFVLVSVTGLAASIIVMKGAVAVAGVPPWIGALIVSGAIPVANFLAYMLWVFSPVQRRR